MAALDPDEYERRRLFCDVIRGLSRPEHIEVARILRKHGVAFSENRSGIFFDMARLSQEVYEELVKFHSFLGQSEVELSRRSLPKADGQIVE